MRLYAGLDEELLRIERVVERANKAVGFALYDGAAIAASAVASACRELPVDTEFPVHPFDSAMRTVTAKDREELAAGVGISHHFDTNDGRGVSISIEGYSTRKEKRHPNGVPLPLIARSIESGSSVRQKVPFIRRAERACANAVIAAMESTGNRILEEAAGGES